MYADITWWDFATVHFAAMGALGVVWGLCAKYFIDNALRAMAARRAARRQEETDMLSEMQELRAEASSAALLRSQEDDLEDIIVWDSPALTSETPAKARRSLPTPVAAAA